MDRKENVLNLWYPGLNIMSEQICENKFGGLIIKWKQNGSIAWMSNFRYELYYGIKIHFKYE